MKQQTAIICSLRFSCTKRTENEELQILIIFHYKRKNMSHVFLTASVV
jgi:hypothetical protein